LSKKSSQTIHLLRRTQNPSITADIASFSGKPLKPIKQAVVLVKKNAIYGVLRSVQDPEHDQ
jgi:hypothetical protein